MKRASGSDRSPRAAALVAAALLCPLLGGLGAGPASGAPTLLADSTVVDRWTLPNGLEVVTRDVPGAPAVSISWGYRYGLDNDTPNEPGLAQLLAEVEFTAAAGDVPERTRDEMESLRPAGWSLKVNRRQTLFTETARPDQLAGVLRQVATRMRGVEVTDSVLARARVTARRSLGEKYFGPPEAMLHWQVRGFAGGLSRAGIAALAEARALDRETPASVQRAAARVFAPANGVLVLAGNLGGLDCHSIVAREFGGLPPGARLPDPPAADLDSVNRVLVRPELNEPMGVLAVASPALTDSLQPRFYIAMLVLGAQAKQAWGPTASPTGTRFQYALLDDPDLVRFYPPIPAGAVAGPEALSAAFDALLEQVRELVVARSVYDEYRYNLGWLLGGPMGQSVLAAMRRDPAALNLLSSTTASRALWGSESFWEAYRRRFAPARTTELGFWLEWLKNPAHQARLLLVPRP